MAGKRDLGSMVALTACIVLVVVLATALALVPVARDLHDAQRAASAADAAALAGVAGGEAASRQLAAANGAVLTSWDRDGRSVLVTVAIGSRSATARATDGP